jgi:hypothetical protein
MRRVHFAALVLGAVLSAASCGGGSGATTDEPPTADPVVTSFEVEDVECEEGAATGTVFIEWETRNATGVDIVVGSGDPAVAEPSGALTLAVPCDGSEHEIAITPLGADGPGKPEVRTVS